MSTPGTYNGWTIYQGSKFSATVTWPGIASAAGYSARMDIRTAKNKASALIAGLTVANGRVALSSSGGNLVITLTIAATDTTAMDVNCQSFSYDLEIVPPSGEADTWRALEGTITFSREVTAA